MKVMARMRAILLTPDRLVGQMLEKNLQQSDNSKILTDANGNASLNMKNASVQKAMHDRMLELSRDFTRRVQENPTPKC
ncbi:hypothetical protein [Serratia proteamaculans]|uniref:hypothetical protein n=1 Tax=Serratia proteamaculans TaxID=28151 RepID=UPI002182B5E5|nr:hypothetical protein [Serratia proteamaculans]CAI2487338.1 Uncharacterised protein [Serratia proteamaculans]